MTPKAQATGAARFLYFEGPDGMVFEYSSGVREIADELRQDRAFDVSPAVALDLRRHHDAPVMRRESALLAPLALRADELRPRLRPRDHGRELGNDRLNGIECANGYLRRGNQ